MKKKRCSRIRVSLFLLYYQNERPIIKTAVITKKEVMTMNYILTLFMVLLMSMAMGADAIANEKLDAAVSTEAAQETQIVPSHEQEKEMLRPGPKSTIHDTAAHPAVGNPILQWSRIDGATSYEVELYERDDTGSFTENGVTYRRLTLPAIAYTTGYEAAMPSSFLGQVFYWRVRGINLDNEPISEFSSLELAHREPFEEVIERPTPMSYYNQGPGQVLLYPVYDWIGVPGAAQYEVEVLDGLPENPDGTAPSVHRIGAYKTTNIHQYDQEARVGDEPFYWRVRAMDSKGNPIGIYSRALPMVTSPTASKGCVAIYGDSISHGGGSISYSPAYWDFSYSHYLSFPTINLAQSGDTSEMAVERFDRDVYPFEPSYLLILIGSNSLRAGVPAADVIRDLEAIRDKCLSHGIRPVLLTIPPINPAHIRKAFDEPTASNWQELVAAVNEYIKGQVHIDITQGMADSKGELKEELAVDGIHLDPPAKKMMAAAINAAWPAIVTLPESAWQ